MIIKVYTKFQNLNFQYNNLILLQETQDELTSELLDLKEKYREVVDLLRDANEEIRRGRKRTYPGAGKHSVPSIFSTQPSQKGENRTEKTVCEVFLFNQNSALTQQIFFVFLFSCFLFTEYSILTIPFFSPSVIDRLGSCRFFLYSLQN